MPDITKTNTENQDSERKSKRSFFGGSLNEKAKDFLDFRYNTQEEIDKLNEEMSTNEELNDVINNDEEESNNERNDEIIYEENKREETKEAEDDLEKNLNDIDEPIDTSVINYIGEENDENNTEDNGENKDTEEENNQIIDLDKTGAEDEEIKNENNDENNEVIEGDIKEKKSEEDDENNKEHDNLSTDLFENNSNEEDTQQNSKFFDPFELDLENYDEEENTENENNMFDPFGLSEENDESNDEEYGETQNEKDEKDHNEDEEIQNKDEEIQDEDEEIQNKDEETQDEDEEIQDEDEEIQDEDEEIQDEDEEIQDEDEDEDNIKISTQIPVNPNQKDENEEPIKDKKIKKNSATGEVVTEEEIQLEQGQDIPDTEQDEEYQPSDEEIFEQEPEFFADDEISQQFLQLVQNVRGTFKLENKDGENDPYFKIIGGKTEEYTTEYLFYLIEEENEPVDLYIKKVETNQSDEEENEHLVQFSYNENQELNIFVDEIILYERVNKSDSDSIEYNDTKAILEKFIFLTENHYNKLKSELDKQREEKKKKRQLQQIFKGF